VNVTSPRLLTSNGTGYYVVGTDGQNPRAYRLGANLEALRDPSTGPLTAIFGIAMWDASEWVLGTQGNRLRLWRVSSDTLVEEQDIADASVRVQPRSFVPLGGHLGFITEDDWFWNVRQGNQQNPRHVEQPLDGDRAFRATDMFPHRNLAVFAFRFENASPAKNTGNELAVWWSEH
jgi:hypothetical protein